MVVYSKYVLENAHKYKSKYIESSERVNLNSKRPSFPKENKLREKENTDLIIKL